MNKYVIIINGSGGVGKDTLCDIVGKHYCTMNISSIDPIKEIAYSNGWKGDKDAKSRKFLADLKRIFTEYNELPQKYLYNKYEEFLSNEKQILFVHIREPEEICKFKKKIKCRCMTLLIRGRENTNCYWNNTADDNVENYNYDYFYVNNKKLEDVEKDFMEFFNFILINKD